MPPSWFQDKSSNCPLSRRSTVSLTTTRPTWRSRCASICLWQQRTPIFEKPQLQRVSRWWLGSLYAASFPPFREERERMGHPAAAFVPTSCPTGHMKRKRPSPGFARTRSESFTVSGRCSVRALTAGLQPRALFLFDLLRQFAKLFGLLVARLYLQLCEL